MVQCTNIIITRRLLRQNYQAALQYLHETGCQVAFRCCHVQETETGPPGSLVCWFAISGSALRTAQRRSCAQGRQAAKRRTRQNLGQGKLVEKINIEWLLQKKLQTLKLVLALFCFLFLSFYLSDNFFLTPPPQEWGKWCND
jgi:hypothetical protein